MTDARNTDWHVITAGPSAGKSSTLRELSARGYHTAPEAARMFIDQKISEGHDADEIREDFDFQARVEDMDRWIMSNLDADETVFMDRSLIDNIAFRRVHGREVPEDLISDTVHVFGTIFLLERLPFEDDYARDEDAEEATEIHNMLRQTYSELGYDVVEVSLMPVDERADYIEEHV